MTYFVCVSLLWGQNLKNSAPEQHSEPQKVYAYDALTKAYIQCVEKKIPVRKASELYNISHTTLRDKLSDRVHIDTLLLRIETVFFPHFCILRKLNVVKTQY